MFVTLCESAFNRNVGFSVALQIKQIRSDAYWFGEAQSRVVVSVSPEKIKEFENIISDIEYEKIGFVHASQIIINEENWGNVFEWKESYDTAIEKYFKNYLPE